MPVNQTKLSKPQKSYTKQDFLDGKCTKDGMPLEGGSIAPEPEPTPTPEPVPETPVVEEEIETIPQGEDSSEPVEEEGEELPKEGE